MPFLDTVFLSNTIFDYIVAGIVFLAALLVFKLLQLVVLAQLRKLALKTKTDIDDTLIEIVHTLKPSFYSFFAFYVAVKSLETVSVVDKALSVILIVWVILQVIVAVQILIDYVARKMFAKDGDQGSQAATNAIKLIAKFILWAFGLLMVLSNLGIDVTALIAGLGIGGLAIALAAQNILADLFSSFSIYFDKPFVIGDFIVIGDKKGTVQKIGIKTTRIKAIGGEELVMSNQRAYKCPGAKLWETRREASRLWFWSHIRDRQEGLERDSFYSKRYYFGY